MFASTFDDPKWLETIDQNLPNSGGAISVADGHLVLTSNANSGNTTAVGSNGRVDLTVSPFIIEIDKVGGAFTEVQFEEPGGKDVFFGIEEDMLFVATSERSVARRAYSPTADRWLRVSMEDGIMVFDTSPDGVTWSPFTRDVSFIDPTWVYIEVQIESGGTIDTARIATLNPHASIASRWCAVKTWRDAFETPALPPQASGSQNNCIVAEGDGLLTFTTQSGESFCGHYTTRPIDLRDASVTIKVTPAPAPMYTMVAFVSNGNRNRIEIEAQNDLDFVVRADDKEVYSGGGTLPGTGEQYWRLGLSGANLRIETSLDGSTWNLRSSTMVPTLDASAMFIHRQLYAGTSNTAAQRAVFGAMQ